VEEALNTTLNAVYQIYPLAIVGDTAAYTLLTTRIWIV
jgi:hypothetical protein